MSGLQVQIGAGLIVADRAACNMPAHPSTFARDTVNSGADWQQIVKSDRGEESEMKFTARIAAASLALATATAGAQSTPTKPYPPGFLKNLAQQMISQRQSMRAGNLNSGVLNIGLNVVHATNCVALQDGVHVVGCIFSQEGLFVCSLNPSRPASATAGAACANGNFVGINIINNQGDANEIISYPNK